MNESSKEKRPNIVKREFELELIFTSEKLAERDFLDEEGHYWLIHDPDDPDYEAGSDTLAHCPGKTYHYEYDINLKKSVLKCDVCGFIIKNPVWLGK